MTNWLRRPLGSRIDTVGYFRLRRPPWKRFGGVRRRQERASMASGRRIVPDYARPSSRPDLLPVPGCRYPLKLDQQGSLTHGARLHPVTFSGALLSRQPHDALRGGHRGPGRQHVKLAALIMGQSTDYGDPPPGRDLRWRPAWQHHRRLGRQFTSVDAGPVNSSDASTRPEPMRSEHHAGRPDGSG